MTESDQVYCNDCKDFGLTVVATHWIGTTRVCKGHYNERMGRGKFIPDQGTPPMSEPITELCGCGKPVNHVGMCKVRAEKAFQNKVAKGSPGRLEKKAEKFQEDITVDGTIEAVIAGLESKRDQMRDVLEKVRKEFDKINAAITALEKIQKER